ncbi:DUF2786 domain-containing protein [Pseudonocardia sp. DR1-2]|uniref:DUF2786 domain-containing protein n=1 Tax=Pseudonocardia sp. DR1-2 TaxID=2951168 RepID=UPI0020436322|nr:DUF2786 domain-containing protein [Pseudonocardia sp. DR1-2]MCM3844831.1 DUF2786 domain-containing protein [Pseudonocardia sp. DR1-2]
MSTAQETGPRTDIGTAPGEQVPGARLDRIRKLLAKAERAGTPDEAEIYTDKAFALMARHGIDEALLAAAPAPGRRGPTRSGGAGSPSTTPTAGRRRGCWGGRRRRCGAAG